MNDLNQNQKICKKCQIIKPFDNFYRDRSRKDGLCCSCKECFNKDQKQYKEANIDKYLSKQRLRSRRWYRKHNGNYINQLPEVKRRKKEWYLRNREEILRKKAIYRKEYNQRPDVKERARKWTANRRKCDPRINLNTRMSVSVRRFLKYGKGRHSWQELVGYSLDELKQHIESQFEEGMSWDIFLQGKIHIDHIIPVSFFNFSSYNDDEFKKCWSLSNLRPLWADDNIRKSDFLPNGIRASQLK